MSLFHFICISICADAPRVTASPLFSWHALRLRISYLIDYYITLTICQLSLETGLWTITVSFFGFIKLTSFNTSDLYMYKLLWLWKFKQLNSKAKPNFLSLSRQAAGTASLQTITKTSSGLELLVDDRHLSVAVATLEVMCTQWQWQRHCLKSFDAIFF